MFDFLFPPLDLIKVFVLETRRIFSPQMAVPLMTENNERILLLEKDYLKYDLL